MTNGNLIEAMFKFSKKSGYGVILTQNVIARLITDFAPGERGAIFAELHEFANLSPEMLWYFFRGKKNPRFVVGGKMIVTFGRTSGGKPAVTTAIKIPNKAKLPPEAYACKGFWEIQ